MSNISPFQGLDFEALIIHRASPYVEIFHPFRATLCILFQAPKGRNILAMGEAHRTIDYAICKALKGRNINRNEIDNE